MGLAFVLLGSMLFTWSMVSNRFFSTMVRIQDERDHKVATEGPYKYVRHPGYVGYILMTIATPISLGSLYALSMAVIVGLIIVVRTILEDETLNTELIGYEEYTKEVRYKLIPYIW
jgi:protein-S-isoprenylcysteine O-methyltransferase Ste14